MYGFIYMLTIMLIIDHRIIPARLFFLFWLTVMVCLSLSIRWTIIQSDQFLNDSDLSALVNNMHDQLGYISYYLREPVFWFGIQFLYNIIGNSGLVIVVMDVFIFIIFYKSIVLFQIYFSKHINFHNLKYLYFGAFLIYPYVAGMHNHYRQIMAVTIAMYAIGLTKEKTLKSILVFLISMLIHNSTMLLLPILFLLGNRNFSSNFIKILVLALISSIFTFIFIPFFGYDGLSQILRRFSDLTVESTLNYRNLIYCYLLILATLFVIILEYNSYRRSGHLLIVVLIYFTIIYCLSVLLFNGQVSSRIFFLVLTPIYILIGLYIETKFKTEPTVRLIYFHISLIPLIGLKGDGLVYYFGI